MRAPATAEPPGQAGRDGNTNRWGAGLFGLACLAGFGLCGCGATATGIAPSVEIPVVPRYGLFEVSLTGTARPANPFTDVAAGAAFTSPSGQAIVIKGFYYGGDEWRVRFVPREHGRWQYTATLKAAAGAAGAVTPVEKHGSFECRGTEGHGFLRLSGRNAFRMEHEDGTAFYPIGVQTCNFLQPDFDGPDPNGQWRSTTAEHWVREFDGAVNLVRTQLGQGTRSGCALPLIAAGDRKTGVAAGPADRYDTDLAGRTDEAFRICRARGMAQILILFQDMSLWGDGRCIFGQGHDLVNYKSIRAASLPLQEQYIRYVVARFGCFVDIWELFNEDSFAPDDYLAHLADVVRRADPYGHIITTNYARPLEPWCQIVTWHEYMGMGASEVDLYLSQQIGLFKSYGKVVQNTEFGNQGGLSNVDPVKWRIAVWTAFMNESGLLFWSMSGRKVPAGPVRAGNANAYLGPDSRQHFRVLNGFTRSLPIDMKPVPAGYTRHKDIRLYALSNGQVTAVYVHHFADHTTEYRHEDKLMVQTGPGRFRARWIDPADGREVATEDIETPQQYSLLSVPPVKIDLACRIDRLGRL